MIRYKFKGETSFANVEKQAVFAMAVALTKTAKDAQKSILNSLQENFTLRGKWYEQSNKFGIKITPAKKDKLTASVHTLANWLDIHETGGVKTPQGKSLAIPLPTVRRNKRQIIPKNQRPRNLKNSFVLQSSKGPVLVQKKGKGKNQRMITLYALEPEVNIKKQSTFYEPAEMAIEENFDNNFNNALDKAFSTAK